MYMMVSNMVTAAFVASLAYKMAIPCIHLIVYRDNFHMWRFLTLETTLKLNAQLQ